MTIPARVFDNPDLPVLRTGVCSLVGPGGTVTMGPDGSIRSCCLSGGSASNVLEDPWDEIARRLESGHFQPMRAVPSACASCAQSARCLGASASRRSRCSAMRIIRIPFVRCTVRGRDACEPDRCGMSTNVPNCQAASGAAARCSG